MALGFYDIGPFIQENVIALNDGCQFIEDRVRSQVDFIEKDPIALLDALDEGALHELENEAAS